ncbi:MAG: fatty acid CoA ligase family protein [Pirellulales bacterium]|nr:fatty acid CoA ligase family protein [Pirellulales bacterium]
MYPRLNVADRLSRVAAKLPDQVAVVSPHHVSRLSRMATRDSSGNPYASITFGELDREASTLARGLAEMGIKSGMRIVLLVPAGIEFVTLVFALLRTGAVTVLVDPGLGRKHLLNCLAEVEPDGFVGVSKAHALRMVLRHRFPKAVFNVTVGRRWFWGGPTLEQVRQKGTGSSRSEVVTSAHDPAAIIFTSGSTGPPKGVLYTQQIFDTQVAEIQSAYDLRPGGVDLSCFPLFGLFNSTMGVATVFPDIDFSRPATADPKKLLKTANDWQVTQSFASPAVWEKLSHYCQQNACRIDSLRQVFSCGAPVPADLLRRTLELVHPQAEMHTPYGATECLPVATIESAEVLTETAAQTDQGAGICVGRLFSSVEGKVIQISDDRIESIADAKELPNGEIGELVVRGPQASPKYVTGLGDLEQKPAATNDPNRMAKISDGDTFWHRMGDVGYFDHEQRFWYCGRKSQRVQTKTETLFTIPVESIFNTHPRVKRTALIGVPHAGADLPVVVFDCETKTFEKRVEADLRKISQDHSMTRPIEIFVSHSKMPVDIRHNSKILREELTAWARQLDLPRRHGANQFG